MKIGIIGAHSVGMRLATAFKHAGHDIPMSDSGGLASAGRLMELEAPLHLLEVFAVLERQVSP